MGKKKQRIGIGKVWQSSYSFTSIFEFLLSIFKKAKGIKYLLLYLIL